MNASTPDNAGAPDACPVIIAETNPATIAELYIAAAHALAVVAHDATTAQQHGNILWQAVTAQGIKTIYSTD